MERETEKYSVFKSMCHTQKLNRQNSTVYEDGVKCVSIYARLSMIHHVCKGEGAVLSLTYIKHVSPASHQ